MSPVRWLVVVLVIVLVMAAGVFVGQRSVYYQPDRNDPGPAPDRLAGATDVTLRTTDGLELAAWRIEPAEPRGMAVLYLPGNAGNRAGRLDAGAALADRGFTVLLLDYRGFGGNPGNPSEDGLVTDARAGLDHLRSAGFGQAEILYVGESIGTGVAAQLAVTDPPAGLLLRSPFTSLPDRINHTTGVPLGWIMRDTFDTLSAMGSIEVPVTVLAGGSDTLIPPGMSLEVAAAAPHLHEFVEVPGAGHNDGIWFSPELADWVASMADAAVDE